MPRAKRARPQEPSQEHSKDDATQQLQYAFRGRQIRVHRGRQDERGREPARLFIDDREVPIEQTESGVLSDEFMFKEFGSPEELAEELIKQWGDAQIKHTPIPHEGHH